ncbi:MAG: hypothetical protein V4558_09835 [Gemmatimonadota bacterium]
MGKPLYGLIIGGVLGVLDGLSALVSAPEVAPQIGMIVVGSMGKGLVAGWIIGFVAKKVKNLMVGILAGTIVSGLLALPFALGKDPETGQVYFWEILIPGMIVGLIVGYATQVYQPKRRVA